MYQDYFDDVLKMYHKKKKAGTLPSNLVRPTPAGVRKECLAAYKSRSEKKDLNTVATFFEEADESAIYKAIKNCDRDRFKALINLLIGRTNVTSHRNIELLAWLINFRDRPFNDQYVSSELPEFSEAALNDQNEGFKIEDKKEKGVQEIGSNNYEELNVLIPPKEGAKIHGKTTRWERFVDRGNRNRLTAALIIGLILATPVLYFIINGGISNSILGNGSGACMIWVGDHYERTACEPRNGDTLVEAFDADRFENFKRINKTDTITLWSVNKLHYIKRNNQVECFTMAGRHPIETKRFLKPLSAHMIETYFNRAP